MNSALWGAPTHQGLGRYLEPTSNPEKPPEGSQRGSEPSSLTEDDFSQPFPGCWSSSSISAAGISAGSAGWGWFWCLCSPLSTGQLWNSKPCPCWPQQPPFHLENISISTRGGKAKTPLNTGWSVTLHSTWNVIKCLNFFLCLFSLDDCLSLSLTASAGPNWQLFKAVWQKAALIKSLPDCNCVKK